MEWDGSSLQDATFEEARDIMSRAGDTVQIVLMHCRYVLYMCLTHSRALPVEETGRHGHNSTPHMSKAPTPRPQLIAGHLIYIAGVGPWAILTYGRLSCALVGLSLLLL